MRRQSPVNSTSVEGCPGSTTVRAWRHIGREAISSAGLTVVAGIGAALYLKVAERARLAIDPLVFFAVVQLQFVGWCLAAAALLDSSAPTLDFDADGGVFGWLQPTASRLPVQLYLAAVADVAGNFGFVAVLKYVPAITVAAVKLLGPCTAILEGLAIGVEEPPGAYTMGGGALILVGSCLFVFSARSEQAVVRIGE